MSNKIKTFVYVVVLLLLTSCRSMKFSFAENVVTKNSDQKFDLVKNQAIITTQLEGKAQRLMLDLGSSACVIFDTSVINDFYKRKKANFGTARGAGSGKIKITQLPLSLNDSLFLSPNKVFTVIDNPFMLQEDICRPGQKIAGLYGANVFSAHKTILLLDLNENKLRNLSDKEFTNRLTGGFQQIKSKFSMYGITVYVSINGKEYPFGFDTGFNGTFIIPAREQFDFGTRPPLSFEGIAAITATGIEKGRTDIYQDVPIIFNETEVTSTIMVSTSIKVQNMGMEFIKGFNWIIDYKHKKIYAKKLPVEEIPAMDITYRYVAKILNNKLIVALRKVGMTDYNVGDEIISINGLPVDDSNKCELLQMLMKTNDWSAFNVKTQTRPINERQVYTSVH